MITPDKCVPRALPKSGNPGPLTLHELVRWHLQRYPALRAQDVYKMFYQAAFGPRHLAQDPAEGWRNLQREFRRLRPNQGEPLVEPIAPDLAVVRVNLRPYKGDGRPLEALWEAVCEAARTITDNPQLFHALWAGFVKAVRAGELPFAEADVEALEDMVRHRGLMPLHHSEEYRRAHRPAYRVLTSPALERLAGVRVEELWRAALIPR